VTKQLEYGFSEMLDVIVTDVAEGSSRWDITAELAPLKRTKERMKDGGAEGIFSKR
jgi:hypothetical protein